ncbi:MAG: hypothetical protein GWP17_06350 [Aquificales bacterium]|nr:hypothetical protein [Aquificales bacterium]
MTKKRNFLWLSSMISLILAALLLAACSANIPAETAPTEPANADGIVEETNTVSDISEIFGETAVSSDNSAASDTSSASGNTDAIPADGEVDASGVPIGFTENGNPYRGNPNAPVVIEEFSDFQ